MERQRPNFLEKPKASKINFDRANNLVIASQHGLYIFPPFPRKWTCPIAIAFVHLLFLLKKLGKQQTAFADSMQGPVRSCSAM